MFEERFSTSISCFVTEKLNIHIHKLLAIKIAPYIKEVYSEPCQTSKMELFAKRLDDWKPLTVFAKSSTLHV